VSDLEGQIKALRGAALTLAVARYLDDHPDAVEKAGPIWADEDVEEWRGRSAEEIGAEATQRLEQLEQWVEDAQEQDPELYETRRIDSVHARMALQSARSGAFGTAAGPLADFLRQVGAEPDTLHLG
jgi:hypothetical protein